MRQPPRVAVVKKFEVAFRPAAVADLDALYGHIADESGLLIAGDYVDRIEAACLSLETSPMRGTTRDDIRQGLRIMGFERRVTILFHVGKTTVTIVRILYGGQDYERALRGRDHLS